MGVADHLLLDNPNVFSMYPIKKRLRILLQALDATQVISCPLVSRLLAFISF